MSIAMDLTMRSYNDADLPRLQMALAGWIAAAGACGYGHIGDIPHRIYEVLPRQRPTELVQIWQHRELIVGFAISGLFGTSFYVATAPHCRGTPGEVVMLQAAYATTQRYMQACGTNDSWVNSDVFSCDRTRRTLLSRLGFVEYRVWDYVVERELADRLPPVVLPPGFSIRSATENDSASLATIRNAAFNASWTTESYRDDVMCKPGYWPEHELLVETATGRIAAFTVIRLDYHNRIGQFEPVGTHPDYQRRGLARALMNHGLACMQQQGLARACVGYLASNQPAHSLYQQLGFEPRYSTLGVRKQQH